MKKIYVREGKKNQILNLKIVSTIILNKIKARKVEIIDCNYPSITQYYHIYYNTQV